MMTAASVHRVGWTHDGDLQVALAAGDWLEAFHFADTKRDSDLDFTQNLEEATDAITLGRRHSWLESEGFSLSAANADVQELPATLYH